MAEQPTPRRSSRTGRMRISILMTRFADPFEFVGTGDEPPQEPSKLVHNERQKLIANFYDRAATAALTVGIFGPVSTGLYQLAGGGQLPFGVWFVILFAIFWTSLALFLHAQARHTLGNLRE